jgi:cysteine synthase
VRIFAKIEGQNPTGSIKDRIVAFMLERALACGALKPGQDVIEATTGNTGISLAMLGRRLGHRVQAIVPETVFPDVVQALQAYGAEVEWVPAALGIKSALDVAREYAARDGSYLLDQFCNHNARTLRNNGRRDLARATPGRRLRLRPGYGRDDYGRRPAAREANQRCSQAAEPHPGNQLQACAA